jgi:hypothetical protein
MSSDVKDEGRLVWVEETDYLLMKESLEAENARFKAQVERLTKAGDAMAEIFKNEMDNEPDCVGYLQEKLVNRWLAAKEGKPRA